MLGTSVVIIVIMGVWWVCRLCFLMMCRWNIVDKAENCQQLWEDSQGLGPTYYTMQRILDCVLGRWLWKTQSCMHGLWVNGFPQSQGKNIQEKTMCLMKCHRVPVEIREQLLESILAFRLMSSGPQPWHQVLQSTDPYWWPNFYSCCSPNNVV